MSSQPDPKDTTAPHDEEANAAGRAPAGPEEADAPGLSALDDGADGDAIEPSEPA
jgi:hypothetical protein